MIFFRNRRLLLSVLAIVIAGSIAGFAWWRPHLTAISSACKAKGSIDTPKVVDVNVNSIEGWAADATGISRIEMWVKDKMLGSIKPGIDRPDVLANFPQCNFPVASGYSHALNIGDVPPSATEIEMRAVNGSGKSFTIGRVPVDFSTPLGVLYIADPIEKGGRNLISGWGGGGPGGAG